MAFTYLMFNITNKFIENIIYLNIYLLQSIFAIAELFVVLHRCGKGDCQHVWNVIFPHSTS